MVANINIQTFSSRFNREWHVLGDLRSLGSAVVVPNEPRPLVRSTNLFIVRSMAVMVLPHRSLVWQNKLTMFGAHCPFNPADSVNEKYSIIDRNTPINPRIRDILKGTFKGTIPRSPKNRYQLSERLDSQFPKLAFRPS